MSNRIAVVAAAILVLAAGQAQSIGLGILNDFEDGTTQGWQDGGQTNNPPINLEGLNVDDLNDNVIDKLATGQNEPGGRQKIFNRSADWTGDYVAAGVNRIRVNIASLIGPVEMRMYIKDEVGNCWVSTDSQRVAVSTGVFTNHQFYISESHMTLVEGTREFADVATAVFELGIVAAVEPACRGDILLSEVAYDDFQATADTDLDNVNDPNDNCTLVANPPLCITDPTIDNQLECEGGRGAAGTGIWGQPDSDNDLYGNACDADVAPQPGPFLSGDCIVNFVDLQAVRTAFFANRESPNYNEAVDFNFDGNVNFADLQLVRQQFFGTPGPGLGNCGCAPEPSALDPGADFDGRQMFVRGGLNLDWTAVDKINSISNIGEGMYQARMRVQPGSYGYKVADADWTLEYTNETDLTEIGGPAVTLAIPGGFAGNAAIDVFESGCYEFNITAVPGDPPANPAPELDVSVIRVGD